MKNESGVTLVEIMVSLTILSIILISIVQFFPQIGSLNQHNEVKTKGMNTAKELLVEWSQSKEVIDFLKDDLKPPPAGYMSTDDQGVHTFLTTKDGLQAEIEINSESDLVSGPSGAYYIHIELKDRSGKQVSETYGYVLAEGEGAD
jgi:prepilin-type N-terminal cleavage/methylation domain-containing protein